MSDKFGSVGSAASDVTDGSVAIYGLSLGSKDLGASQFVKTNAKGSLVSSNLTPSDVLGLDDVLHTKNDLSFTALSTKPTLPQTGFVGVYARSVGGVVDMYTQDASGVEKLVGPSLVGYVHEASVSQISGTMTFVGGARVTGLPDGGGDNSDAVNFGQLAVVSTSASDAASAAASASTSLTTLTGYVDDVVLVRANLGVSKADINATNLTNTTSQSTANETNILGLLTDVAANTTAIAARLPLSGGTMTGNLNLDNVTVRGIDFALSTDTTQICNPSGSYPNSLYNGLIMKVEADDTLSIGEVVSYGIRAATSFSQWAGLAGGGPNSRGPPYNSYSINDYVGHNDSVWKALVSGVFGGIYEPGAVGTSTVWALTGNGGSPGSIAVKRRFRADGESVSGVPLGVVISAAAPGQQCSVALSGICRVLVASTCTPLVGSTVFCSDSGRVICGSTASKLTMSSIGICMESPGQVGAGYALLVHLLVSTSKR